MEKFNCISCDVMADRFKGSDVTECDKCLWNEYNLLSKKRFEQEGKRKAYNRTILAEELHKINIKLKSSKEG